MLGYAIHALRCLRPGSFRYHDCCKRQKSSLYLLLCDRNSDWQSVVYPCIPDRLHDCAKLPYLPLWVLHVTMRLRYQLQDLIRHYLSRRPAIASTFSAAFVWEEVTQLPLSRPPPPFFTFTLKLAHFFSFVLCVVGVW